MGNRANVIFVDAEEKSISPCIYLHWNGGPESIYPFLDELDRRKVKADQNYEAARFIEIVAQFMADGMDDVNVLSLGVVNGPKTISANDLRELETDDGDNGFYIVDRTVPNKRSVRRFVYDKEMSATEVVKEREEAYKHSYNTKSETIAETFLKITKGKNIF
jgi:hypothetical protein